MESLSRWQDAMKDATGKDAIARQTDRARAGFEKAMNDMCEMAQIEAQHRSQAWKVVQDRFQENLASLQKLMSPR